MVCLPIFSRYPTGCVHRGSMFMFKGYICVIFRVFTMWTPTQPLARKQWRSLQCWCRSFPQPTHPQGPSVDDCVIMKPLFQDLSVAVYKNTQFKDPTERDWREWMERMTKHLITEMKVIFWLFHSGYVLKRKNNPVGRCIVRFCVNSAIERPLSCPLCVAGPVSAKPPSMSKPQCPAAHEGTG